jgi:hypothetical protein
MAIRYVVGWDGLLRMRTADGAPVALVRFPRDFVCHKLAVYTSIFLDFTCLSSAQCIDLVNCDGWKTFYSRKSITSLQLIQSAIANFPCRIFHGKFLNFH